MFPPAHAIIPARYASTRFPGKPLAVIHGKPMFWHVWNRTCACPHMASVTLATDDERIASAAEELGVPFVMTASEHESGTDRIHEAASILGIPDGAVVVNVQGDEPALHPQTLTELLEVFIDPQVRAATLAHRIRPDEAESSDKVKVVLAHNGDALYFSRLPIPFCRDAQANRTLLGHIGLYAFTRETLDRFVALPPSSLEKLERLEQLRLLENGIPLRVAVTSHVSFGVDTPEDLQRILPYITP